MEITRRGLVESYYNKKQKRIFKGVLRGIWRGAVVGVPIDSIRKQKLKIIKQCDMCGITILQGKHCKPCSSEVKIGNAGSAILDKVYKI